MGSIRVTLLLLLPLLVILFALSARVVYSRGTIKDPAEQLFRQTMQEYSTRARRKDVDRVWEPWSHLADKILSFLSDHHEDNDTTSTRTTTAPTSLQSIGALEESILTIERAIYEMGQPDDMVRDKALAHLYYAYSKLLLELTAEECLALAKNPHTLLMGAETVTDSSSTHVCRENAENHLRNAVTLDATHHEATALLEKILGQQEADGGVHQRKPKEFVAELFDSFADTFDKKLVQDLAYQVPLLVGQAARNQRKTYKAVLDAGCGTGLAGRHLRPLVPNGPMIGVDASQKMLDIAGECTLSRGCGLEFSDKEKAHASKDSPLYNGLLAMDLEEMSVENTLYSVKEGDGMLGFDLVVAADVLVYFGRLDDVLAGFAAVSAPGATLIVSCERTTSDEAPLGWRLLPSGRFAHTKEHAIGAAGRVGYSLQDYSEITPRMEKGEPVKGHLFVFALESKSQKDEL